MGGKEVRGDTLSSLAGTESAAPGSWARGRAVIPVAEEPMEGEEGGEEE
jgi:hypothetical protein